MLWACSYPVENPQWLARRPRQPASLSIISADSPAGGDCCKHSVCSLGLPYTPTRANTRQSQCAPVQKDYSTPWWGPILQEAWLRPPCWAGPLSFSVLTAREMRHHVPPQVVSCFLQVECSFCAPSAPSLAHSSPLCQCSVIDLWNWLMKVTIPILPAKLIGQLLLHQILFLLEICVNLLRLFNVAEDQSICINK